MEESVDHLYKWQTSLGLYRQSCSNYNFSFGPFGTHKIKTKVKYQSIFNILHLLNTPDSVPCVEPVPASLVVDSKSFSKFLLSAILSLIVVSRVCPSRAKTRRFLHLLLYLGQNSARLTVSGVSIST